MATSGNSDAVLLLTAHLSRNSPRTLARRSHQTALTYTGTLFSHSKNNLRTNLSKKQS